ncbi:PIN domain-containing protein [Xylophilus rhododendri]|uniref:PIN domain-containing protein n=1 Tax=Xylophilus rhododendri TaxID=2697032 RepID=A0A857J9S4_9BURK|nr:PIN domain-containing protein [Xylophilus rhododendri]QHJ00745.1 PIN domain-containing protein [Xylophilus rhododendri]
MTLVDANVLIDLVEGTSDWYAWSESALLRAAGQGPLLINAIVYAEIARDFASQADIQDFLRDLRIGVDPLDEDIAFQAARAHAHYRQAGGQRHATLPDFFIGAHASVRRLALLTRDSKRIQTYFPDVELICPSA